MHSLLSGIMHLPSHLRERRTLADRENTANESFERNTGIDRIDQVLFSAYSRPSISTGEYQSLKILMHTESQLKQVEEIKKALADRSMEVKSRAPVPVARSQIVKIRLESPVAKFTEPEMSLPWTGIVREFDFLYYVYVAKSRNVPITANVYIDDIIATRLQILISVNEDRHEATVKRQDVHEAFVSYSFDDVTQVLNIVQGMHRVRPDLNIFIDVENLRSGVNWQTAIKEKILASDTLFLCWSRAASKSKWVDFEWRFAYNEKGIDSIEPIPLEPPQLCPPPNELAEKHFNDVETMMSYAFMRPHRMQ